MTGVLQQGPTIGHEHLTCGGDRGAVLAVLDGASQLGPGQAQAVLAYAQMVSVVQGRPFQVLLVRPRLGFSTDAAVVAARRHRRRQVLAWLSSRSHNHVEIDELSVPRRVAQDPAELWERVLLAARARGASCVVVSQHMSIAERGEPNGRGHTPGDEHIPGAQQQATTLSAPTVLTVLTRSSAHRSQDYGRWT